MEYDQVHEGQRCLYHDPVPDPSTGEFRPAQPAVIVRKLGYAIGPTVSTGPRGCCKKILPPDCTKGDWFVEIKLDSGKTKRVKARFLDPTPDAAKPT